jgi:hypothetical protein
VSCYKARCSDCLLCCFIIVAMNCFAAFCCFIIVPMNCFAAFRLASMTGSTCSVLPVLTGCIRSCQSLDVPARHVPRPAHAKCCPVVPETEPFGLVLAVVLVSSNPRLQDGTPLLSVINAHLVSNMEHMSESEIESSK